MGNSCIGRTGLCSPRILSLLGISLPTSTAASGTRSLRSRSSSMRPTPRCVGATMSALPARSEPSAAQRSAGGLLPRLLCVGPPTAPPPAMTWTRSPSPTPSRWPRPRLPPPYSPACPPRRTSPRWAPPYSRTPRRHTPPPAPQQLCTASIIPDCIDTKSCCVPIRNTCNNGPEQHTARTTKWLIAMGVPTSSTHNLHHEHATTAPSRLASPEKYMRMC
jgi:hypothetical protein